MALASIIPSTVSQLMIVHMFAVGYVLRTVIKMPWRVSYANVLDLVVTVAFMLFLLLIAFFVPDNDATEVVEWAGFAIILFMWLCIPAICRFRLLYLFVSQELR